MKKKTPKKQESKLLPICYEESRHGWIIKGQYKPLFSTQTDLENHCRNKLGRIPVVVDSDSARPGRKYYGTNEDEDDPGSRPFLISGGAFEMNRRKH
jgi:hypothetical protein